VSPPAPYVNTRGRPTLRVLGTKVTLIDEIKRQAERDLGIRLEYSVLDGITAQQRAATQPSSFDVYDQWFNNIDIVWSSGAIQPLRVSRIASWPQAGHHIGTTLMRDGRPIGRGDAPIKYLYVQPDKRLGPEPSDYISAMPGVHHADAFGYRRGTIAPDLAGEAESWGWLLDNRCRGRVALVDDPAIGAADAALAAQALGLISFKDIGNLTIEEIDALTRLLIRKKRAGHFRKFWSQIDEATTLMETGAVDIESLWTPSLIAASSHGVELAYAAPKEGYRGWHGCLAVSINAKGAVLDAAYDYLNWWLSGWAGAVMARQGYYIAGHEAVIGHLSPAEWGYWYLGEPASTDLCGPDGTVTVRKGALRNGGSYWDRLSRIVLWNSSIDEHNYLVRRWAQFIAA
jgi:putative spermidine/putrescine transport system substrate-binding protein